MAAASLLTEATKTGCKIRSEVVVVLDVCPAFGWSVA